MKYNTATLDNGLRVIHLPSTSPVVYCGYQICAGSRDEQPGEEGLAHFCEHATFKGTEHRRAWNVLNCLESVGGDLNAFTTKEDTTYHAAVLKEHIGRAIDILTDIVFHSIYPQAELDKEVEVVCDEIESYNDSPSELIYDEFENLIFKGHPLGHAILGTAENVRSFNAETVKRFAQKYYRPDNSIFFVYGDVPFGKVIKKLKQIHNTSEASPSPSKGEASPNPSKGGDMQSNEAYPDPSKGGDMQSNEASLNLSKGGDMQSNEAYPDPSKGGGIQSSEASPSPSKGGDMQSNEAYPDPSKGGGIQSSEAYPDPSKGGDMQSNEAYLNLSKGGDMQSSEAYPSPSKGGDMQSNEASPNPSKGGDMQSTEAYPNPSIKLPSGICQPPPLEGFGEASPLEGLGEAHIVNRQTHQTHVMLGSRAYDIHNSKRMSLYLLNNILGGPGMNARLNFVLREKRGLVYTVDSTMVSYGDVGLWCTYFGCDPHDLKRCLRLVRKELDSFIRQPITPTRLHAAKKQLKGQIGVACDNRENFALDFGKSFLHYGWEKDINTLYNDIDRITAQDIHEVATEIFAPEQMTTLIYQ